MITTDMGYDRFYRRNIQTEYSSASAANYDALHEERSLTSNSLSPLEFNEESGGILNKYGDNILDQYGLSGINTFQQGNKSPFGVKYVVGNTSVSSSTYNFYNRLTLAELNFNIIRPIPVMFVAPLNAYTQAGGSTNFNAITILELDGSEIHRIVWDENGNYNAGTHFYLTIIKSGTHTIYLKSWIDLGNGNPSFTIYGGQLYYITLGS